MIGWHREKQGKSEKDKKQRESRDQGMCQYDDPKLELSVSKLANAKTRNRRELPSASTPNVRRETCCGNRG